MPNDPDWKNRYAGQLCSPAEAVAIIEPGQRVFTGVWTSTPPALCAALAGRAGTLKDITIVGALATFDWTRPEILEHYRVVSAYTSPLDRRAAQDGRIDYVNVAQFRDGKMPPGIESDVALVPVSPPDADGWCSLGVATWFGPTVARNVPVLIGEVHPEYIRT